MPLPQSDLRTIAKLTCWVCGAHPSTLERRALPKAHNLTEHPKTRQEDPRPDKDKLLLLSEQKKRFVLLQMLLAAGARKMLPDSHTVQQISLVVSYTFHEWSAHTQSTNGRLIHNPRMVVSYANHEWSAHTRFTNGRRTNNSRMVGSHIIHEWSVHTQFTNGRLTHN